jgi:hypothetical protein
MTLATRTLILRANAIFLLIASTGGFITDIAGSFFGRGVEAAILNDAPGAGIGLLEAHGLAFIIGVLLWRAAPLRSWHFTAAAVHLLLGSANLAFWQFFIISDALVVGIVTTSVHWALVALQLTAAIQAGSAATAGGIEEVRP